MENQKIKIYTDGAAKGNPGHAGWGAVILYPLPTSPLAKGEVPKAEGVLKLGGHAKHATNNQMELTAPIEALKYLKNNIYPYPTSPYVGGGEKGILELVSDSKYVILGITQWIYNWQKNNWRNAAKKPVLNRELWEELFELTKNFKIKWTYVKGHNGDKWNERADEIATSFAEGKPVELRK
ncbi:MAG: ribonuclease H [Minisyncoccia bacterium]